ncbi:MAG: TIGR01212 family radical SAM protein [Bacteroidales bacterium]|nr:TIGR01212 family radical SAM protein [Bacteroidales bacterium]
MRYSDYCLQHFGHRVQKLTIDAGFNCPNRDGTIGSGGCTFCNNDAFNPAYCHPKKSITQQIDEGIRFHSRHRAAEGYLAYFQAYSGTHAPLETLRQRYEEALSHPKVEGIIIGTRPDCVDDAKLDYLATLSKKHFVMVEYGIESCYDRTLALLNRGHDYACTVHSIRATAQRAIPCGGHLILGLPHESREEILAEATMLSQLPLTTLKLHQLQILRGSQMGYSYLHDPSSVPPPFGLDEYIGLVCDFLERLRPDIIVERYASHVPPRYQADTTRRWLHADGTPVKADQLYALVEKELRRRNSRQGILSKP